MTLVKPTYCLLALSLAAGALALSGLSRSTQAQTPSPIDCQNANDTPSINYCAEQFYKEADQALNQTYQQLQSKLSRTQQQKLVAAQRAWIEYRDKNCDFEVRRSVGGTGYAAFLTGCLERMTEQRTSDLQQVQR